MLIKVNGKSYTGLMPQNGHLDDRAIAPLLTYIRANFGNRAKSIDALKVKEFPMRLLVENDRVGWTVCRRTLANIEEELMRVIRIRNAERLRRNPEQAYGLPLHTI